jgi:hypothetical protein
MRQKRAVLRMEWETGVNTLDWYLQEVIDMICSSQKEVAYHGKRSNEQGNR